MPPRHAYWTIIVDDQPTAFRAHDAEELEPTLNRLKEKHPTAVMRWFERGKLWESRDAARAEGFGRGERRWEGPRPERPDDSGPGFSREGRGGDKEKPRDRKWRPGGDHRDPRQKYKDAKKAKWDRFKTKVRARTEERVVERPDVDPETITPPHGDPLRDQINKQKVKPSWRDRPPKDDWKNRDRSPDRSRPQGDWRDRPKGDWRDRPQGERRERPQGNFRDRPQNDRRDRPAGEWQNRPRPDRPQGDWKSRPQGDRRDRPKDDWRDRPKGDRDRPQGERRPKGDWRDRPQGDRRERPQGDRRERPKGEWRDQPKSNWSDRPKKSWQDRPPATGRGPKDRDRAPRHEGRKPWGAKSQGQGKPKSVKPFGGRGPGGPRRQGAPRGPRKRRDDE